MNEVAVRYIVHDAGKAIDFYTRHLGFTVQANPAPGFAILARGNLRLLLNEPGAGGAGQTMPDGSTPEPGGWCRIQLRFDDLEETVRELRAAGVRFRSDIIHGRGGDQILAEDPSGNPIELFSQPA
jgi:catechol 2,3-dioxygenase-like lactoylglutathione lyase family enzyme